MDVLETVRKKFFRRIEKSGTWEKKDVKSMFMRVMLDVVMNNGKKSKSNNDVSVKKNRRKAKVNDAGNTMLQG